MMNKKGVYHLKITSQISCVPFRIENEKDGSYFVQSSSRQVFKLNELEKFFLLAIKKHKFFCRAARVTNKTFNFNHSSSFYKLIIIKFIQQGLIDKLDRTKIAHYSDKKNKFKPLKLVGSIFLFSCLLMALIWVGLIIKYPKILIPKPRSFFFSQYLSLNLISSFLAMIILAFGHELAHVIVALTKGVKNIKLRLAYRMYYLVMEVEFLDIYMIKEKHRYPIYLAGILFDLAVMSALGIILVLNHLHFLQLPSFLIAWLGQIYFLEAFSVLWEFIIFLKTDLYYCLIDFFDIESFNLNLKDTGNQKNFKTLKVTFLLSKFILLLYFLFVILPIKLRIFETGVLIITSGQLSNNLDGLVSLVFESLYFIALFSLLFDTYKQKFNQLSKTIKNSVFANAV